MMNDIQVNIDFRKPSKPFRHFFSAVGYANVDFTYTEPFKKMYDYLSSFNNHFRYMRLHNILTSHGKGDYYLVNYDQSYGHPPGKGTYANGGDTVVTINEQGELCFDWTTVDKVYDILMEHGIRPIVETVYMPHCIQKSSEQWYLPKDYGLWKKVIQEFVIHLQERYGKEEIEQWYFEVYNEPDNVKPWVDDPQTFLALYDYLEEAVHSINPQIKVGGPAVKQSESSFKIFRAFLDHCSAGLNYATGKFGTRVDFISVHCKGGWPDGYNPSMDVMFNSLRAYAEILKEYPEFDGVEFFNDESDIVWGGNKGIWVHSWLNFRNTHYFPGFVCKMVNTYCNVLEDQYGLNLSIVDSDNCHLQWEKFLFSGNRSQFTPLVKYPSTDLIKKPSFNAYVLLSRLGNQRLSAQCIDKDFGIKFGVLPTIQDNVISMMVWNFEDGIEDDVNDREIRLSLKNVPFKGKYKLLHYRIDKEHSSSYNTWKVMGKPENPSVEQIRQIREKEGLELYQPVQDIDMEENLNFDISMPMHSVSLLLLLPVTSEKPCKPFFIKGVVEKGFNKNPQVFLKWTPNKEIDFFHYILLRKRQDEEQFMTINDNTSLNTGIYIDMDVEAGFEYSYKVQAVNASLINSELSDEIKVYVDKI